VERASKASEVGHELVPVLVITGPVGVGKTTVAGAMSELLDQAGVAHALVDVDYLRWCHPSPPDDPFHIALGLRNLRAVWANYREAGAERLIVVDIVESRADVAGYQAAVPGAEIRVVRLQAALPTILRRLEGRETGASLLWHQQRAAELVAQMTRDRVEDLLVDTEGKRVPEIAQEVLARARWTSIFER
jgi:energy-coupling factor transporter ATP-binding protein EcfA2